MDTQLAWRNIWRNPRRTMVILIAVIIGVWSMLCIAALMRGIVDGMIQNGISTLTGHIQIHQKDYPSDPVVDHRISVDRPLVDAVENQLPAQSAWSSRVRVNAVASNARHSTGVSMVGIDPDREAPISFIATSVTQGRYLKADDRGAIIIGKALAEQFETRIGKKIILMSQSTDGQIASRAFRIVGIFQSEMESTEKQYAFVPLKTAQKMLGMGSTVSEVAILLSDETLAAPTTRRLRDRLEGAALAIRSWQEILPIVFAVLKLYDIFVFIWFLVIFIAMGFGIVNTTLMSVFERMREFGLLKALGMRPGRIIKNVLLESSMILLLGIAIGNVLAIGCMWALSFDGIDLSALAQGVEYAGIARIIFPVVLVKDIISANLVVLLLGLTVSLYPAIKAARFLPVEALAHN